MAKHLKVTREAWLITGKSYNYGLFGRMLTDTGWSAHSLELPWRNNTPRKSCIPTTRAQKPYICTTRISPRFGHVYLINGVPNRSLCLFHPANFGGNSDIGWLTELEGCCSLGEKVGVMKKQPCLLVSRPAITRFMLEMNNEPFHLHVISTTGEREWVS